MSNPKKQEPKAAPMTPDLKDLRATRGTRVLTTVAGLRLYQVEKILGRKLTDYEKVASRFCASSLWKDDKDNWQFGNKPSKQRYKSTRSRPLWQYKGKGYTSLATIAKEAAIQADYLYKVVKGVKLVSDTLDLDSIVSAMKAARK